MRRDFFVRLIFVGILAALPGCGGGGSSGGGGGGQSARTGVRILHGALDDGPVQVVSSLAPLQVVEQARFAENTYYAALNTGAQQLSVRSSLGADLLLAPLSLDLHKGEHYSVLLYGSEGWSGGLQAVLLSDLTERLPDGVAAVRVVHALHGALNLSVALDGASWSAAPVFGSASQYEQVAAGLHTMNLRRASDSLGIGSVVLNLESGHTYTVFATGEINYFVSLPVLEDFAP